MSDRFRAKNPESWKLRFHAQTGGSTLTAQQIENNVVRIALQALAAVLGGCQSLHTNSRDEALALPTEDAARLALRTQQIIAYEIGIANVIDPFGGSYFIEQLTDEIEQRVWKYIEKIDAMGGAVKAIEQNFYQNEIAESAYKYQLAIEKKEKIIVGMNDFITEDDAQPEILKIDASVRTKQIERLQALRAKREGNKVSEALSSLQGAAEGTENVVPHILECVEVYATVGEISNALRKMWGEYGLGY